MRVHILALAGVLFAVSCSSTSPASVTAPTAPSAPSFAVGFTPPPPVSPTPQLRVCASMPPYGGNDATPPAGGCFGPGSTLDFVTAVINSQPQGTWGLSGRAFAYPEQLPDGTWHVAVSVPGR